MERLGRELAVERGVGQILHTDTVVRRRQKNERTLVDNAGRRTGRGLDVPESGRCFLTEARKTSRIPTVEGRS